MGRKSSSFGNEVSIADYGAVAGTFDSGPAIAAAIADLQEWDTLYIPNGKYLTAQKLTVAKHNVRIKCDGVIGPHGSFSDYLFVLTKPGTNGFLPDVQTTIQVESLRLDCNLQCRGVRIANVDCSDFNNIQVYRPYGTGIKAEGIRECAMASPRVISGIGL